MFSLEIYHLQNVFLKNDGPVGQAWDLAEAIHHSLLHLCSSTPLQAFQSRDHPSFRLLEVRNTLTWDTNNQISVR